MKRSRASYEAASPLQSEYPPQHAASEQYGTSNAQESYCGFLKSSLGFTEECDPLQQIFGPYSDPYKEQANTSIQPGNASNNDGLQRNYLQAKQSIPQYSNNVLFGVASLGRSPGPIDASSEIKATQKNILSTAADASLFKSRCRSYSVTSQSSAVTKMCNPATVPAEASEGQSTPYNHYRSLFLDSNAARDHRHSSTRFGRQPYIAPEDDPTIAEVEGRRDLYVGRIYNAMVCGYRAQDNTGSIAMKRWVHGAHYKSDLVEAFAHKVFDCLLVQVKEGFRGWHHNDYVDDDRKGEKGDREADCMVRLENIIDALEREKTICEDVVNSASQIRMFVNAPIAYAARKYQNRLGNSKRGRTKDKADSNPPPPKSRRAGGRRNRARSTVSDVPTSRDTTPQLHAPATAVTPYFATPCSLQSKPSTSQAYSHNRRSLQRPIQFIPRERNGNRQVTATAPPMTTRSGIPASVISQPVMSPPIESVSCRYNMHRTAMPPGRMLPAQRSPILSSPLTQHHSYRSAHPSPDDARYLVSAMSANFSCGWPTLDTSDNNVCTPLDPSLTPDDPLLTQQAWSKEAALTQAADTSNYPNNNHTATHVSLADIEHVPLQPAENAISEPFTKFDSFWNDQPGVQQFSFDSPANNKLNRD